MKDIKKLIIKIAEIGKKKRSKSALNNIQPFKHFFNGDGRLLIDKLDAMDGPWNRRELLARCLLLSAVLDQGPDMEGVRSMVVKVINELYRKEIRIFHRPLDFFKEIGIAIDNILKSHDSVKKIRSAIWAKENKTNPDKYNLFMDNSRQVLNYAIFRWGVPLAVPLLLEKDGSNLVDYLEKWPSSEEMSQELKDNERYGLGKAIGDKAAHLFAKWYVDSFAISRNKNKPWGKLSFELPMDSNAGRVLFRTGYFMHFTSLKELEKWQVIQKNIGKGGTHYIRVTNLRGKKSTPALNDPKIFKDYVTIYCDYLKIGRKPRTIEIQRIPNVLLLNTKYGIGDLDDGLMYIGTNVCLNLEAPKCNNCPIKEICLGYKKDEKLITDYRT